MACGLAVCRDGVDVGGVEMSRRPARVTQADIARSIRAAEQVGHGHVVEIAPDGTIRIVPANGNIPARSASVHVDEPRKRIRL